MTNSGGIKLAFAFSVIGELAPTVVLGTGPHGIRRMVPILSGTFTGPQIRGTLMPGGIDWQIVRPDGITEIEAHYSLQTDDGALIRVINRGYRHGPAEVMQRLTVGEAVDPAEYYFRAAPSFEAPEGRYDWLNRYLFISTGERRSKAVTLNFYQVL